MQRLGKNHGAYFGETIRIQEVLSECHAAARASGWTVETIPVKPGLELFAYVRRQGGREGAVRRLYISAGIHGDEPAGPLAARQLLRQDAWPEDADLWLCPCLNPSGFEANCRENADGMDLNRQYLSPKATETIAHIGWLQQQPKFDVCLCLHEDWESHGFYLYELNPDAQPSRAELMIERVRKVCPVDDSELIEGRPAKGGIIRPDVDPRSRPDWPEAFFLLTHKTRHSYTLEAPSDFPLPTRVAALVTGVNAALEMPHGTTG